MTNSRLQYLFQRHLDQISTDEEKQELLSQVLQAENDESLRQIMDEVWLKTIPKYHLSQQKANTIFNNIVSSEAKVVKMPARKRWLRYAVAASILLIIGLGIAALVGVFTNKKDDKIVTTTPSDVQAPQNTKATITLADGRIVTLDSAASGTLATQGSINVIKTADGQIVYDRGQVPSTGGDLGEAAFNTLANPRGSKVIDMTLADGSRVWLNAGSSVTYPVAFIGNERKVSITGEAYFEVAHDVRKPFYVSKGDVQVQVLGTHFNVNAYDDEQEIKVTLLEGSVRVIARSQVDKVATKQTVLKPGEQAVLTHNSQLTIHHPDLEQVMAWKNGMFSFDKADIKTIMRELARWYDVEVIYTTDVKPKFYLKANRNISVSNIFKILETTGGVHLEIDGKKIIVTR